MTVTVKGGRPKGVLRFAVAMRGGVSLAVWIGGALREIDRLQEAAGDRLVTALLDMTVFSRVEIDILTGASAGGLNAALGGYSLSRGLAMDLQDVWIETADIDALLELPRREHPFSILNGKYFEDQVVARLRCLAKSEPVGRPVEVFLAATVFGGVPVRDPADLLFVDRRREGVFHFRHLANSAALSNLVEEQSVKGVGKAARASASFPAAFEPVLVETQKYPDDLTLPPSKQRPSLIRVIDGGVVDNIPVARAIHAAAAAPAGDPVRRWILFLHPNPPKPGSGTPNADPEKDPSILAVLRDLMSKVNSETLLDDLDILREHNHEAARQAIERYSLSERAFDPLGEWPLLDNVIASVDAYSLYELLDDPPSVIPWLPIGEPAPVSPILDLNADARYEVRTLLIDNLVNRPDAIRPYARLVRLAYFAIETIRWAERNGVSGFGSSRLRAYDVLFLARLLDAILCRSFLDDREFVGADLETPIRGSFAALEAKLKSVEGSPALRALLTDALATSEAEIPILWNRLDPATRSKLEDLARGWLPDGVTDDPHSTGEPLSSALLQVLVAIVSKALGSTLEGAPDKSIFTLLRSRVTRTVNPLVVDPAKVRTHLLALDAACGGLHMGHAVGVPISLDYARISGAAETPLATKDPDLSRAPRFCKIIAADGGIDPDLKLSGNKLASFSAFIAPRFRANDWMWGRMDAASTLIEVLLHRDYAVPGTELMETLKSLLLSPFRNTDAEEGSVVAAAEQVCKQLWDENKATLRTLAVDGASGDGVFELARKLAKTRWHLEILATEMPKVLKSSTQPKDDGISEKEWAMKPEDRGLPREQLQRMISRYEDCDRRIGDLWGRRQTSALGIQVARETAWGLAPRGRLKRLAISVPLMLIVSAVLTRGAFLVALNTLVGIVLLPRLPHLTLRITIAALSLVLSGVYWRKVVWRPTASVWRKAALILAGGVSLLVLAVGTVGLLRPPNSFSAALPWEHVPARVGMLAVTVGSASAIAAALLWNWARPFYIALATIVTGAMLGAWTVLGAWKKPDSPSPGQTFLGGMGSMWIAAGVLAVVFASIAVLGHPENRKRRKA